MARPHLIANAEQRSKISGKLPPGATCGGLTSAPQFGRTNIRVKWRGLNPSGRVATVGTNRSLLASVSWDDLSSALMTVTDPIARGAFVGSTITLHLGLDDVARFLSGCTTGAVLGQSFGVSNPSTISVP